MIGPVPFLRSRLWALRFTHLLLGIGNALWRRLRRRQYSVRALLAIQAVVAVGAGLHQWWLRPALVLEPATVHLGPVRPGSKGTFSLRIRNRGRRPQVVMVPHALMIFA